MKNTLKPLTLIESDKLQEDKNSPQQLCLMKVLGKLRSKAFFPTIVALAIHGIPDAYMSLAGHQIDIT